jgi:hypothetical protein
VTDRGRAPRSVRQKKFHWLCIFFGTNKLAIVVLSSPTSKRNTMANQNQPGQQKPDGHGCKLRRILSVRMSEAWRVEMKYVLVTVALVFSTSAFGAVDASPPTELPGCELVGTVKNMGG